MHIYLRTIQRTVQTINFYLNKTLEKILLIMYNTNVYYHIIVYKSINKEQL